MKKYNFDEVVERRNTDCIKYDKLNKYFGRNDLLPLWVADMDFRTPDFIIKALKNCCERPVFGYTYLTDEYYDCIINWIHEIHGWEIQREWISFIPGIVKGIAFAIEHYTQKGDKVIIQPPVYHPFRLVPQHLGREVVNNPLRIINGAYEMDFDNLESVIDEKCKILILSSPHNPAGIVWNKKTLQQLASICSKHNILVISDEIHAEMIYPGGKTQHHPFPTVSDEAASCSITFTAPSKTFNIAGIISSYAIIPNETIRHDFYSFLEAGEFNQGSVFSYIATIAAYTKGAEWRRQMLDYIIANANYTDDFLRKNIPQIKAYMPQASFLIWLDCHELHLSHKRLVDLFTERAGLALNDGVMFGEEGNGFMRMNIGCPRSTIETALNALNLALLNKDL